jgi:hypothetical protein
MTPNHPPKWQRNGSGASLVLTAVLAFVIAACGITTGPLSNIDPGGRDYAKVDADKLACWQEAEAASGGLHSRTRYMMMGAVGAIYQATAADPEELKTRDGRIERHAEACMVSRGYTVRQK